MFKRISIILLILFTLLAFTIGAGAVDAGLFVIKDAANTYIDYVDADGTSIMKIDDTDGVTIANEVVGNTYTSITITDTTDATSLTAASIITPGGIACTKQLWIGDDIDMSTNTTGVYDITLKDGQADGLSIVAGSTDMVVFTTATDAILITPPLTVTGLVTLNGGLKLGADGAGFDVTFYGDTSGADFVWDQDGDTNGNLTLGSSGGAKGVDIIAYGHVNTNYLHWDQSGDDLLLVGTSTTLAIAGTLTSTTPTTGSLKTAGGLGVAENVNIGGTLTVSVSGAGTDVKIWGNTAAYYLWFDANGDTNGAFYIGADTKGLLFNLYGDTTGCGVFWNPSTDTNGTLSVGATGGSKGVDFVAYGDTNGSYLKWDQSADELLLVASTLTVGASAAGTDAKFWGGLAASYVLWDASEDRLIVQNTFAADANVSTYEYGQYNGMIFNTDITTGKMVSGMKIAMEGTADYDSGSGVWPLWIDIQNTGTNNSDNFDMARFSVQSGACLPNSYISFQTASPGVDFLFEIVGDVSPFGGDAGTYSTADGYLLVNTPDGTRRIALYAAVD